MARWSGSFRHTSVVLGRVPSLAWGAFYLICIPAFAALYSRRPSEFFHSTLVHEPSSEYFRHQIQEALAKAVVDNFVEAHGHSSVEVGGEDISVDDIRVFFSPNINSYSSGLAFDFRVLGVTAEARVTFGGDDFYIYRLRVSGDNIVSRHPNIAFPCPQPGLLGVYQQNEGCLFVDAKVADAMEAYINSQRGLPLIRTGDHFWRMLYFSAVTITTLGYGDIVPLTTTMRALVTVEIILGPIMFGLFLNSLVREGLHSMTTPNPSASTGRPASPPAR